MIDVIQKVYINIDLGIFFGTEIFYPFSEKITNQYKSNSYFINLY